MLAIGFPTLALRQGQTHRSLSLRGPRHETEPTKKLDCHGVPAPVHVETYILSLAVDSLIILLSLSFSGGCLLMLLHAVAGSLISLTELRSFIGLSN